MTHLELQTSVFDNQRISSDAKMLENKIVPFEQNTIGTLPKHQNLETQTDSHMESMNGRNKFSNNNKTCKKKCQSQRTFDKINNFKCDFPACNYQSPKIFYIKKHKHKNHRQVRSYVKQRLKSKAHDSKAKFKCTYPECEFKSVRNAHLKAHINTVHEKKKDFECNHCNKSFSLKSSMKDTGVRKTI